MTWTEDPLLGGYRATGDDYSAMICERDKDPKHGWYGSVYVRSGGGMQSYSASTGTLPDATMARVWAEAALQSLRRIAEQLGELKS